MSEITRAYEFRIWDSAGSAPEYTFDDTDIVGLPVFGWTTPRPLEGKTENIPSTVQVLDTSEQITSILADAGGRGVLMGRIGEIRTNEDGGGMATRIKGRISAINMTEDVSIFDFFVSDERWLENALLFNGSNTTRIVPAGPATDFANTPAAKTMNLRAVLIVDTDHVVFMVKDSTVLGSEVIDFLDSDILRAEDQTNNFRYTRVRIDGADRNLITFGEPTVLPVGVVAGDPLFGLRKIGENGEPIELVSILVYWPTHGLILDDAFDGTYIYAPDSPANEFIPIHVGGKNGTDRFSWLKDQYDTVGVRYETNAFTAWDASTNPDGLIGNPLIPPMHWRAVKPERLRVMTQKVCQEVGIVPFVNSIGEVTPRFVTMPHDVDPTGLTTLDESDVTVVPGWSQDTVDIITVLEADYSYMRHVRNDEVRMNGRGPIDRVDHIIRALDPIEHDRVSQLGEHVHKLDLTLTASQGLAWRLMNQQARELFDRYGDGPMRGAFNALSAAIAVEPGDHVILSVSAYPNMASQARGGTRIVQVMGRETAGTRRFSYLDTGPNEQPLQAPGCAIAQTAGDTFHSVDVTISSLTAGSRYQIQLKIGSDEYRTMEQEGDTDETVTFPEMPSGTTIFARARETAPGRIRSAWSSPVSVATATIGAPTGHSVGSLAGDRVTGTWTNADDKYQIEVLLDGTSVEVLTPGAEEYVMRFLTVSTTYNSPGFTVRHVDRFGGVGTAADQSFSTTGTPTTLPEPRSVVILVGGAVV